MSDSFGECPAQSLTPTLSVKARLVICAFNAMSNRHLLVVGDGQQGHLLKALSGPNVQFTGFLPRTDYVKTVSRAQAYGIFFQKPAIEAVIDAEEHFEASRGALLPADYRERNATLAGALRTRGCCGIRGGRGDARARQPKRRASVHRYGS